MRRLAIGQGKRAGGDEPNGQRQAEELDVRSDVFVYYKVSTLKSHPNKTATIMVTALKVN